MRHRDEDVGNFFLAEKADGEAFTDDDEEVLTLFASQAAAAITNARTHRRERRTRADLEALVETSPIGVVVFDARAGRPVSFNREARRIVESLRTPGRPVEQLEVVSVRRADGREVSLAEMPLEQTLGTGETVRAEEVVLAVPDGRSVRTLINATPIRADGGEVGSVTGAPQDLPRIIRTERPRLVLLDLVLPKVDGIELMRQVPELADLPVIFISGYGRDEIVAKALEAGAADYIVKPFSPIELVARVRAALRRREEPEPFVVGGSRHRLRAAPGDGGRRAPVELTATEYELLARALSRRGAGRGLRDAAAAGLGQARERRREPGAHLRPQPPPQARRQRRQPRLHLQPARRRLPHWRRPAGRGNAPPRPPAGSRQRTTAPRRIAAEPRWRHARRRRRDGGAPMLSAGREPCPGRGPARRPSITSPTTRSRTAGRRHKGPRTRRPPFRSRCARSRRP